VVIDHAARPRSAAQAESLCVNSDKKFDIFQRVSLLPRDRFLFFAARGDDLADA
jgi:hypothetical protein